MIQIQELKKSFGKNQVLKGINLNLEQAGITAILGPNGSGKTTLIKCILGMVIPDSGKILFDGHGIQKEWGYRNNIDYLPQIARFPENLSIRELLKMIKDIRSNEARDKFLIEYFGLGQILESKLGNLSGGTMQKVNLVQAFMFDSPVLILDEPTVGLDPVALQKLKKLILKEKEQGKIIILTTHIMSFVDEMADNMVYLLEGKIHMKMGLSELYEKYKVTKVEQALALFTEKEYLVG